MYVDDETVKAVISREIRTSHQLLGYRAMWKHISQKYNLNVKRSGCAHDLISPLYVQV